MTAPSLFAEMVAVASRTLSASVAPFTMSRLLLRARVLDRDAMTPAQALDALPTVEAGLAEFLTPAELRTTMAELREVIARRQGTPGEPETSDGLHAARGTASPRRDARGGDALAMLGRHDPSFGSLGARVPTPAFS